VRQSLVFDADDTLWENNVLYEQAIADYLDWLAHPTMDRNRLRAVLDEVESVNANTHGYGSAVFVRSLTDCFAKVNERDASPEEVAAIAELTAPVVRQHIELIPKVAETLLELSGRHDLFVLTKGSTEEQEHKVERSGLAGHFRSVHVVAEKNIDTYRRLTEDLSLDPSRTWMIGNSPKSDILPARAAGWGAVFIPHPSTWVLEQAELDPSDQGVLHLTALPELLTHF
jgi:putative hydrolase of the HAD superfamily